MMLLPPRISSPIAGIILFSIVLTFALYSVREDTGSILIFKAGPEICLARVSGIPPIVFSVSYVPPQIAIDLLL